MDNSHSIMFVALPKLDNRTFKNIELKKLNTMHKDCHTQDDVERQFKKETSEEKVP